MSLGCGGGRVSHIIRIQKQSEVVYFSSLFGAFSQDHDDMMHDMPMDNDMDALLPVHSSDATPMMGGGMMKSPKSCVSREDCCAAVMCMIECCSCPITKAALMECCEDIMAGDYD